MTYAFVLQAAIFAAMFLLLLLAFSFLAGFLISWFLEIKRDRLRTNQPIAKRYAIRFLKSLGFGLIVVSLVFGLVMLVFKIAEVVFM